MSPTEYDDWPVPPLSEPTVFKLNVPWSIDKGVFAITIPVLEKEDKTLENLKNFYDSFYLLHERYPIETEIINKFPDIKPEILKQNISHLKADLSPQI